MNGTAEKVLLGWWFVASVRAFIRRRFGHRLRLWPVFLFVLLMFAPACPAQPQGQGRQAVRGTEPVPEPAVQAILAAFDQYQVVGLPQGHGLQDLDNLIFDLIRNPAFSEKVNDIELEGVNSRYQPVPDRYLAGEDVRFAEVQQAWRKSGQPASGGSGFLEEFFPLVRALNQKLPLARRLRVLAGEPAVDWDQIKSPEDAIRLVHRDASIASVMEKEILAKHRKALMLFEHFISSTMQVAAPFRYMKRTIPRSRWSSASWAFSIRTCRCCLTVSS